MVRKFLQVGRLFVITKGTVGRFVLTLFLMNHNNSCEVLERLLKLMSPNLEKEKAIKGLRLMANGCLEVFVEKIDNFS